jgi:hypothetical protein
VSCFACDMLFGRNAKKLKKKRGLSGRFAEFLFPDTRQIGHLGHTWKHDLPSVREDTRQTDHYSPSVSTQYTRQTGHHSPSVREKAHDKVDVFAEWRHSADLTSPFRSLGGRCRVLDTRQMFCRVPDKKHSANLSLPLVFSP